MKQYKRILVIISTIIVYCMILLSTKVIVNASMFPLEEVKAYLILNGKSNKELSSMKLDDILNMLVDSEGNSITISNDATTVWRYTKSDEDNIEEYKQYHIGKKEVIDLSVDVNINTYTLELIIGSSNQLDTNNIRYIIKVFITNTFQERISYELYSEDLNGIRNEVKPNRVVSAMNHQTLEIIVNQYIVPEREMESTYYLGISSIASEYPNVRVEVYNFWNYVVFNTNANPITSFILNQDMQQEQSGMPISYGEVNMFAIVYFDKDNKVINQSFVSFAIVSDSSYIDGSVYIKDGNKLIDTVLLNVDHIGFEDIGAIFTSDGIHEICLMLKEGYSLDSEFYCILKAHGVTYGEDANSYVIKAVEGHYNSLEETSSCIDIKEQLIPSNKISSLYGYKGNYDYKEGGIPFTIFFEDGSIWKLRVLVMEYNPKYDENYIRSFTEAPIIGEADPWLRVIGAKDNEGNEYDTYVIENGNHINMDTYYGYGYQTVLIKDADAKLSKLKPNFWYANTERVYATSKDTGEKIEDGHLRDFRNNNQQYVGIIIDNNKENERNYWVTFKKLNNNGAELFVYGPNEREVILDEYFEFKHDILIANIGNIPLEDISVELLDAQNVKLDTYWTIGGKGNNTLESFTATSFDTQYGELPNISKIRLLPDGTGEVKGTLIVKAKNQNPVKIDLHGTAQNPEIITEKLKEAVKYVPYQHIISTNNMHDWVETKFSIVDGVLPEGIALNSDTGELYGVPIVPDGMEEVIYTFTVEAKYLVDGQEDYFDVSYKKLKLVVKPNTNKNVYLASDSEDGYYIEQHIGTEMIKYEYVLDVFEDTLFVSKGQFWEFKYLWLNGEKLEEGIDFVKEEGSTKITIKSQTFENKVEPNKTNTIAMEFRNEDNELHRTSQNFVLVVKTSIDIVIAKIDALPSILNITIYDKREVRLVRIAYDSLSIAKQKKVTNRRKLFNIESKIARLEGKKIVVIKLS